MLQSWSQKNLLWSQQIAVHRPPTSTRGISSAQHDTTLTASWCQQASVSHGGGSGSRRSILVRGKESLHELSTVITSLPLANNCISFTPVWRVWVSMREYVRVGVAVWVKRRNHPMRRLLFIDLQQIFVLIEISCSVTLVCNWFRL